MRRVVRSCRRACRWFLVGKGSLKRGTDRLEMVFHLFLLLAVLSAVPAGLMTGSAIERSDAAVAAQQAHSRHQVQAVALADAQVADGAPADAAEVTTVAWPGLKGRQTTAVISVEPAVRTGDHVPIWVTIRDRKLSDPPLSGSDVRATAAWVGIMTGLGIILIGLLLVCASRRALDARRFRQWEADWQAVEPVWTSNRR